MDKGAHFYRSDLQVHSPRDPNWTGPDGNTVPASERPTDDRQRLAFALRLVGECRDRGIAALAVTDHHDMTFIPFVQLAAQLPTGASVDDINLSFDVANPSRQNPVVFPGVEVTIDLPLCQALVLLDAECLPSTQAILLEAIGVGMPSGTEPIGPDPVPIHESLNSLRDRIDRYASGRLKKRYIIIPHVTCPSGHKSILTTNTHRDFAQMHCVAGYIEKDWADQTRRDVLDGRVREYGNKALGIFQTSDSRRKDFRNLGCRTTWVKMAEPTAEALRQACLARQSRISQVAPTTPTTYISRIKVSDSTFMGAFDLDLNPQFNAIIGGRGTGKSTILEYLRQAMQDQPVRYKTDIEESDGADRKRRLIQDTLDAAKGQVAVHWLLNGVPHVVRYDSGSKEITLQVADQDAVAATAEKVRRLLPIRAFSQKQLSSVSTRTAQLQHFVEQPIQNELAQWQERIDRLREEIRHLYSQILTRKKLVRDLASAKTELTSIQKRANAIEKGLPKLTGGASKAIKEHAARLSEAQAAENIKHDLNLAAQKVSEARAALMKLPDDLPEGESPQGELLESIHRNAAEIIARAINSLRDVQAVLKVGTDDVLAQLENWETGHEAHLRAHEAAQKEAKAHETQMSQLRELRKEEAEKQKQVSDFKRDLKEKEDVENQFTDQLDSWIDLHKQRGDALENQSQRLTAMSDGDIEAKLIRGADIRKALDALRTTLKGAYITQDRWDKLSRSILEDGKAPENWRTLMLELRQLAETKAEDVPPDMIPPPLECWDLTENQRRAILEKLQPETWLEIALMSLRDRPEFHYRTAQKTMPFERASAGQQATALLKVLLNEEGGPLIIDQPEDDLDNAVIEEVVSLIWTAKQKRQVIFASHNANIVVNGDAELVIHCDYVSKRDRSRGEIKHLGAIDVRAIRDVITRIMEGGKKAFTLRRQKYGF